MAQPPPQSHPAVRTDNSLQITTKRKEKKGKDISDGPVVAWDGREVWRKNARASGKLYLHTPECLRVLLSNRASHVLASCMAQRAGYTY